MKVLYSLPTPLGIISLNGAAGQLPRTSLEGLFEVAYGIPEDLMVGLGLSFKQPEYHDVRAPPPQHSIIYSNVDKINLILLRAAENMVDKN